MWSDNKRYDDYMGRWSRKVARRFLPWVGAHPGARWLDVGCGTGALTSEIARFSHPSLLCGVDPSAGYLGGQSVAVLGQADARALPFATGTFDYVVSGLVLNFVPDIPRALQELRRVAREEAVVGVYVWDYAEGMELLRYFWQVAGELDSDAANETRVCASQSAGRRRCAPRSKGRVCARSQSRPSK
jgi:ubiquinone/menaquinone biosynthesis C-methylase UbiE